MKIAVIFVGALHDKGFNASALKGAERMAAEGVADIEIVSGVTYDNDEIRACMTEVLPRVDGFVLVGGQGNAVAPDLAASWPDRRFAIVQGMRCGANLASYDVRQEESAFLAGCLAARMTATGTVGHLSGHRVRPGLKGRAGFVAGARYIAPEIEVLTAFCGTQDDSEIVEHWTQGQIDAGADVIFTMLNGARDGATAACRRLGARQIGNALDWVAVDPEVFIASAMARIDIGVERAMRDMVAGTTPSEIVELGLAAGDLVALSAAPDVPRSVLDEIEMIASRIRTGEITIPDTYDGPEFAPEDAACATTG